MLEFPLTIKIWKENKRYIAYNPELDVSSSGKNPKEAKEMLKSAMSLFINDARKRRVLETILKENGFLKKRKGWVSPEIEIIKEKILFP